MNRIWLAVIGICIVACVWRIQHPPALPTTPVATQQDAKWQAATLPARPTPPALKRLARQSPWGLKAQAEVDANLTAPNWRIMGAVINGAQQYVLIQVEGQPATQINVGDFFPGGSRLLAVQQDKLGILLNGKSRSLRIYRE